MSSTHPQAVIVTGAASGIGQAVVAQLTHRGTTVVAIDRDDLPYDDNVVNVLGDLANSNARHDLLERLSSTIDHLEASVCGLVNCAGVSGSVAEYARRDAVEERALFEVNYFALGEMCRSAVDLFEGSAAIVNIASVDGVQGRPRMAQYSASKHAVVGLTRSLARELGHYKIRVNAVAPGPVETGLMLDIEQMEPGDVGDYRRDLTTRIPLGRYGRSDEIATVICFLLSEEASYVSGATWTVDGGLTA